MTEYHSFEDMQCVEKHSVRVTGAFSPAGAGAVTGVTGRGFTVARTGVGEYTVTLNFPIAGLVRAAAELRMATAEAGVHLVQIGAVDTATNPAAATIVITHKASADTATTHPVAADVAAAAASSLCCDCLLGKMPSATVSGGNVVS